MTNAEKCGESRGFASRKSPGSACERAPARMNLVEFDFTSNANAYALMKKYMCLICGHIYDEALGDPDTGVAPGTKWEDVPPNWTCPDCGARKEDYELVEF
jgi:rubredoxin